MKELGQFGGMGKVVECDESVFGHTKYGKGQPNSTGHTWVLGCVERGGNVRSQIVPSRGKSVIHPILKRWILPDTTLITDEWKGYNDIVFKRLTICHITSYSRYDDNEHLIVNTNSIEGYWSQVKSLIKLANGISIGKANDTKTAHDTLLQSYLDEASFRYNNRDALIENFYTALRKRYVL
ncbi:unnamed protein product [Bursaphelenchus okinawaensis]|uniref:ISXO2-like transposase domain-containing protein n=1 Tax=Bursaphelenchus okinawaensis TaxID=465554 RepID=A0A811JVQ3_9BILA|nr:unnamed protein product [Bursaphelenchus okinawaensis]CAG9086182.1 unnamed protein product [Bursaphelenchus okinawaensis]